MRPGAVNLIHRFSPVNGFSLVELMLSLSLGLGLSGVMLQGLMAEGQNGARLSRLLRERAAQRRTLELVKNDVARATAVSENPEHELHACGLARRTPVLHLNTSAGPVTYSVGKAPSTIWRGWVLMRCGPAFGMDGEPSLGSQAQNRVVIDGLAEQPQRWNGCASLLGEKSTVAVDLGGSAHQPFSACLDSASGLVAFRLMQILGDAGKPLETATLTTFAQDRVP
jgi:type II secretory pathway pseudopilin PulG